MNSLLFEQIDNSGLVKQGKVDSEAISRLTVTDIIDFVQQSVELTDAADLPGEKELFTHSASLSLGGGSWPCANVECRKRKAEEIAQFAAFYSDRVYIHNFLEDILGRLEHDKSPDEAELKTQLDFDLQVLNILRPLIEAEAIIPITTPAYCPRCFAEHILKQSDELRVKKGIEHLTNRYRIETTFLLQLDKHEYILKMKGPEELIEHGRRLRVLRNPPLEILAKHPNVKKQIESGEEVRLSNKAIEDMHFDEDMAQTIFRNVRFELITSQCLSAKFVTERTIDIDLIKNISCDGDINRRNQIVQKHLTSLVPFLGNIATTDILRIKKGEMDAFLIFRKALNETIDECRKQKSNFSEADARAIYQDILRPRLAHLNQKVKTARKSLVKTSATKILAWTGAITFGLYTGFLPTELAGLAKALGLTKVLAEITENLMSQRKIEKVIQNEDLYFLWKVRREVDK